MKNLKISQRNRSQGGGGMKMKKISAISAVFAVLVLHDVAMLKVLEVPLSLFLEHPLLVSIQLLLSVLICSD